MLLLCQLNQSQSKEKEPGVEIETPAKRIKKVRNSMLEYRTLFSFCSGFLVMFMLQVKAGRKSLPFEEIVPSSTSKKEDEKKRSRKSAVR